MNATLHALTVLLPFIFTALAQCANQQHLRSLLQNGTAWEIKVTSAGKKQWRKVYSGGRKAKRKLACLPGSPPPTVEAGDGGATSDSVSTSSLLSRSPASHTPLSPSSAAAAATADVTVITMGTPVKAYFHGKPPKYPGCIDGINIDGS